MSQVPVCSGGLGQLLQATHLPNVYVRLRAQLYRETRTVLRRDPRSPQAPQKILYVHLSLNLAHYNFKMKTLHSSLTANPTNVP